ncbi:hypothetical protein VN97_g4410 [Penicillium thymicola]|uniref:Uncharacterized protein n=1 Tax=Penicillium thymicola TaxID=293382 RepID=A0AAI9TLX1_PENTH|nr:hypothetical protein VN97_g4410 [Penicillium thymicola]
MSIGEKEQDRVLYMEVASNGGALEETYRELDEDEKPVLHKELGSFALAHVKNTENEHEFSNKICNKNLCTQEIPRPDTPLPNNCADIR